MILVDLSQVMISTIMAQLAGQKVDIDEDLLRHMVLNTIRHNRVKFKEEFGNDIVICCDSGNVWRKDIFPYYKARRKVDREASPLNWNSFFEAMANIREEIKNNFPYKVIRVERAEADDIIAVLVKELHNSEKILILSGDKDYQQLHRYRNVAQYSPVLKKYVKCNDPEKYLKEHILKGDVGDGVPNVLSDDTVFVQGKRQTPLTAKRMAALMGEEPEKAMNTITLKNYSRNQNLVDFNYIPSYIHDEIMEQYNTPPVTENRGKLFNYFIAKKLKNLMNDIGDF